MTFKYQKEYDKLTQTCPPADHIAQDIVPVYRWVFDSIDDERNFKSQFHKKPKRFLNKDDLSKCSALGLSMFNNLVGSVQRFNELKDATGDAIYQTLGTKIAEGKISLADGVNSKIERLGHFNHHPSSAVNFNNIFTINGELV
ncbi:MAG: hypothetical protein ACKVOQ_09695 [Cyclobacteriaceae bacterium]